MGVSRVIGSVAAAAATLAGGIGIAPGAHASNFGVELNGTYAMKSDGEQAKTNEVFIDEATVTDTWTIHTDCVSPIECTGQVISSQGWTANAVLNDFWYFKRDIPNWMPCPDGTFATGHQLFLLLPWDPRIGTRPKTSDILTGRNITKSDSGACGVNQPKDIELPLVIQKIG